MPVFLTQLRNGDVLLTAAADRAEAVAHFLRDACVEDVDVVELKETEHLTFSFGLNDDSSLRVDDYGPFQEAYRICFPSVMTVLGGNPIGTPSRDSEEAMRKTVQHETRFRKMSKLSRRLENEAANKAKE